jgi:RND family efflux transporter MFP subunit
MRFAVYEKGKPISEQSKSGAVATTQAHGDTNRLPALVSKLEQKSVPPSRLRRRFMLWSAALVVALVGGAAVYFQPWVVAVTEVSVEIAALAPVTRVLALNGRIAGVQSVDLRPQVAGTLTEVMVHEGQSVVVGAELAQIDPQAQQAVVRQAVAGLDAALVAQADAQATLTRYTALGSYVAQVTLESASRAVLSASQEVARMTALLDQAQIQLGKFTLRAPLPGTVVVLSADPGQSVDGATVLMTIVDLGKLVVETDVDESYAAQIKTGQAATIQLSGQTALRAAKVSFVSKRVVESTGGLAVKLTPDVAVVAPIGQTVTANITVDDRPAAITVPRSALLGDTAGQAVFVAVDGMAQRREIALIDWPATRLIVTQGLAVGDMVISNAAGLTEGQVVNVVQP